SRALLRLAIGILLLACTSLTSESCAKVGGDSVDDSRRIKVGGAELYVEIRGPNRSAPLLLWLHGGPGGPERPLFRYFNSDLERHFLVAYLDQRGAGRSFDRAADTTGSLSRSTWKTSMSSSTICAKRMPKRRSIAKKQTIKEAE